MNQNVFEKDVFICFHPYCPNEKLYYHIQGENELSLLRQEKQIQEDLSRGIYFPYLRFNAYDTLKKALDSNILHLSRKMLHNRITFINEAKIREYLENISIVEIRGRKWLADYFYCPTEHMEKYRQLTNVASFVKKDLKSRNFINPSNEKCFVGERAKRATPSRPFILFSEQEIDTVMNYASGSSCSPLLRFYFDVHLSFPTYLGLSFLNSDSANRVIEVKEVNSGEGFISLPIEDCFSIKLGEKSYAHFSSLYCGYRHIGEKEGGLYSEYDLSNEVDTIKSLLERKDVNLTLLSYVSICRAIYAKMPLMDILSYYHLNEKERHLKEIGELYNRVKSKNEGQEI